MEWTLLFSWSWRDGIRVKILTFSWSRRKAFNPGTGSFQPCGRYFGC